MSENDVALVSKCIAALCGQVGIVDVERFIYLVRNESFDYTNWQREYYDKISPDELDSALDKFSAAHEFKGSKAQPV